MMRMTTTTMMMVMMMMMRRRRRRKMLMMTMMKMTRLIERTEVRKKKKDCFLYCGVMKGILEKPKVPIISKKP